MIDRTNMTLTYGEETLRVVFRHGRPWYSAADLCRILGVSRRCGRIRPDYACSKLGPEDKVSCMMPTARGPRVAQLVTERGLYAICGEADVADARPFRDWMVDEALPAIRRFTAGGAEVATLLPEDLALMREASALIERLGARLGDGRQTASANACP